MYRGIHGRAIWIAGLVASALAVAVASSSAQAEPKVGSIILYPSTARAGRIVGWKNQVLRVAIVREKTPTQLIVQEINHPSRYGVQIVSQDLSGKYRPYFGLHTLDRALPGIFEAKDEVMSSEGVRYSAGSIRSVRRKLVTRNARVLYGFENETHAYVAVTDEDAWRSYETLGKAAFEAGPVPLRVVRVR